MTTPRVVITVVVVLASVQLFGGIKAGDIAQTNQENANSRIESALMKIGQ